MADDNHPRLSFPGEDYFVLVEATGTELHAYAIPDSVLAQFRVVASQADIVDFAQKAVARAQAGDSPHFRPVEVRYAFRTGSYTIRGEAP